MKKNELSNASGLMELSMTALKSICDEHPKETELALYGLLSIIFGAKFVYELRARNRERATA